MDLKTKLLSLLEEYDSLIKEWASKKANKEKFDKLKDITIASISSRVLGKSEAERLRKALVHPRYQDWVDNWTHSSQEFYEIDAKKRGIEQKIDVYRSLLSHDKAMIGLTL